MEGHRALFGHPQQHDSEKAEAEDGHQDGQVICRAVAQHLGRVVGTHVEVHVVVQFDQQRSKEAAH
eukprot:3379376-Prymnesium_polylepis.1